jgi:hypothetical protein
MVAPTMAAAGAGAAFIGHESFDRVESLLSEIRDQLTSQAHYAQIERERSMRPIWIGGGDTYRIDAQMRGEYILVSGGTAGDVLGVYMGTSVLFDWEMASTDPKEIDIPMLLQGDISITNLTEPTRIEFRAWLFAHPDQALGKGAK